MKKKSHLALSISCLPLCFIEYHEVSSQYINLNILNHIIINYNSIIQYVTINNWYILLYIPAIIFYFIGVRIPDLDNYFKFFFNKADRQLTYLYHRQFTHSLLIYTGILAYILYNYNSPFILLPIFFIFGILTHLLGDMLTGSIPWAIYGHYGYRFTRIGVTIFLPKFMHTIFTRFLVTYLDRNLKLFIIPFVFNLYLLYLINFSS